MCAIGACSLPYVLSCVLKHETKREEGNSSLEAGSHAIIRVETGRMHDMVESRACLQMWVSVRDPLETLKRGPQQCVPALMHHGTP